MVKALSLPSRDWIGAHSEAIFTVLMIAGWLMLGSFLHGWVVRDTLSWWKLAVSAPMIVAGWCFIVRHD